MRDLAHNFGAVTGLAAATYTADATGVTVDRQGFDALCFLVAVGVAGDTLNGTRRLDFHMEHSDDGAAWDPVPQDSIIGATLDTNGAALSYAAAHPNPTVARIGYVDGSAGDRRYVRLSLDIVGTHTNGTPVSVVAVLGEPHTYPVAA